MHQCAAPIPRGDARLTIPPRGVPVIKLINQTDITYLNRRADGDVAPDLYRGYEIAGAAHVHDWVLQWGAANADVDKTGAGAFLSNAPCRQRGERGNLFPTQYVLNAAFENLDRWSRRGIAPPRAQPLDIADPARGRATLALDEFGNARGGLRTPYVDVPRVRYGAYMDGPGICELWGYEVTLPAETLRQLYPTREAYVAKVRAAAEQARRERWLTAEDAALVVLESTTATLE